MAAAKARLKPRTTTSDSPEVRIAALFDAHGPALMPVARQFSLCSDDAHDALQRAMEIYLRRLATVDPATEGAWLKVVIRHEAMAIRRSRAESLPGEEIDFDARADEDGRAPEERLAATERSARAAEVLRRLKPDEATALLHKAEGLSYDEIGQRYGWSYTKVNRVITEGRRRFLKTYAELERGDGCEEFLPVLDELARGSATAEALVQLRPHLRHCPACRATVRELRGGRRRAAAWLPLPAFLFGRRGSEPLDYAANAAEITDGAAVHQPIVSPSRWAELKLRLQEIAHRLGGSDVATSAQVAAASGGGRSVSIAAALGICLSSVGAGTYCVATLVLPDEPPKPVVRAAEKPKPKRAGSAKQARPAPVRHATAIVRAAPTATPAPARRAQPARKQRSARRSKVPSRVVTPVSHEDSPPPAPAPQGQQELSFETSAPAHTAAAPSSASSSSQPAPAAAPATGGGEFAP